MKMKQKPFLWDSDKWQAEAHSLIVRSRARLVSHTKLARQARDYLNNRAIWIRTAQRWRLGQAVIRYKDKNGYQEANAIIIPWVGPNEDGLIKAVQYRFIDDKASRRFHGKYGGQKTIFGAHLLAPSPEKILFIVEGEFNTVSISQEALSFGLALDVISVGGESISDKRLESLVSLTKRYRGCAAWFNRERVVKRVGEILEDAMLLKSPGGQDANDLAQAGELASLLEQLCAQFD